MKAFLRWCLHFINTSTTTVFLHWPLSAAVLLAGVIVLSVTQWAGEGEIREQVAFIPVSIRAQVPENFGQDLPNLVVEEVLFNIISETLRDLEPEAQDIDDRVRLLETVIDQEIPTATPIFGSLFPSATPFLPSPTWTLTATLRPSSTSLPPAPPTATWTPTSTATLVPLPTFTPWPTVTLLPTASLTPSQIPTLPPTLTSTPTYYPSPTWTLPPTPTASATLTLTPTFTPTDTPTPSPTHTPTYTFTPSPTPSDTPTFTPTFTPTWTPTWTPTATSTLTPSLTPTVTPLVCNPPLPVDGQLPDGFVEAADPAAGAVVPYTLDTLVITYTQPMTWEGGVGSVRWPASYQLINTRTGRSVEILNRVYDPGSYTVSIRINQSDKNWTYDSEYELVIAGSIRNLCGVVQGPDVSVTFSTEPEP
jgi:hypothetical protein